MIISCFILCLNNDDSIEKTLKYASQSFDDIVVLDGGSQDDSLKIIEKYNVRFFENKNPSNLAEQLNFAIEKCKGDWVVRLDSDEIYDFSDWGELLQHFDKFVWQLIFPTYHLQRDIDHYAVGYLNQNSKYLQYPAYQKRVWRNYKKITYKKGENDRYETLNTGELNQQLIEDKHLIHFGHLRSREKQIQRFKDFSKMGGHSWSYIDNSEDSLYTRNQEWDKYIKELPEKVKQWVKKF